MSLKDAPPHVVLAVDLIQLLETNEIAPEVAIPALEIVLRDYRNKALEQSTPASNPPLPLRPGALKR